MAMTRSEIELLIRAKNEAGPELQNLNNQLGAVGQAGQAAARGTGEMEPALDRVTRGAGAADIALGFFASNIGIQVVNSVAGAVREMASFSSELADAREKTGATAVGLQRVNESAQGTDVTFKQIVAAMVQLNDHLGSGSKSTVKALGELGLTLHDFDGLNTDQKLELIDQAISGIPDKAQQTQIAIDLMGRGGAQLLPILTGHMKELGDAAEKDGRILREDTVTAWDDLGDTWGKTAKIGKGLLGNTLGPLLEILNPILKGLLDWKSVLPEVSVGFQGLSIWGDQARGVLDAFRNATNELPKVAGPATEALKKQKDELASRGLKAIEVTEQETKAIATQNEQVHKATIERERLNKIHDTLFGQDDIKKAQDYAAAIGSISNVSKLTADTQVTVNKAVVEALADYKALGKDAPAALLALEQATNAAALAHEDLHIHQLSVVQAVDQLKKATKEAEPVLFSTPIKAGEYWDGMVRNAGKGVKQIPSFWAEIVPDVAQTIGVIQKGVEGSFAQMLLGAKGWKDGMVDIWHTLKAGVLNILNDILAAFINNFLKGLLGAMSGQQGAFSSAFSGLFGGGFTAGNGGANTGSGGILAGLFGGGAGGFGSGGPGDVGPVQGGGFGAAQVGGGLLAVSGLLELFKAQGKVQNTLAGAQTGAGIGTMFAPGIGTAIGAGIGALAGFVKSLFKSVSDEELAAREVVGQFEKVLKAGLSTEQQLEAGGESWKATVIAVRDAYAKVGLSEQQALDDVKALWDSSRDGGQNTQAIIEKIAAAFDKAKAKANEAADGMDSAADAASGFAEEGAAAGDDVKQALQKALLQLDLLKQELASYQSPTIRVPFEYVATNDLPDNAQLDLPAAAGGFYASGARPAITIFGEGGQPEVGGPASFFERIFDRLGVGGGGAAAPPVTVNIDARGAYGLDTLAGQRQLSRFVSQAVMGDLGLARRLGI